MPGPPLKICSRPTPAARDAIRQAPRSEMSFTEPEWSPQRVRDEEATVRAREGASRGGR